MSFKEKELKRKELKRKNYIRQTTINTSMNYNNENAKEFYIVKNYEANDMYTQN